MISAVLGGFDHAVWRFFIHHPFLVSLARTYTKWGVASVLLPLALAVGVLIFFKYKSVALAVVPMFSLQVNDVLTAFFKSWFHVARPPRTEWLAGAAGGSFPSGHMANTTSLVVATVLVVASQLSVSHWKKATYVIGGVLVSLMGWSRLALNVHWLSDVLAGWILGSLCATAAYWLVTKLSVQFAPTRQTTHS